jgi:hypothetical protein
LLKLGDDIGFVRWTSAASFDARRLNTDRNGKIANMVLHRVPVENFSGAEIVVADIPVRMRITRAMDPVPPWCMVMYMSLQVKLYQGPMSSTTDCLLCDAVAKARDGLGQCSAATFHDDVFCCKLCLGSWHRTCAADLMAEGRAVQIFDFVCPRCM